MTARAKQWSRQEQSSIFAPDKRWPTRGRVSAKASFQTTSFLDATILIYAIGAGITAAAGTRLALQ